MVGTNETFGTCIECGHKELLTDDDKCTSCTDSDEDVEYMIRKTVESLIVSHDLPTVFWSLDNVYDDLDDEMMDRHGRSNELFDEYQKEQE